jgi:aryl-alcohol dehydrogenase-like predicted oxidoreductase
MALNDYYTLGSSGLRVSSLALGTMIFDDGSWGSRPADSFAILDCYLGLGGNFIDTANFYGGGQSEEALGAYFTANPGKRERVVLATKFCMSLIPDDPNAGGAGRKAIIAPTRPVPVAAEDRLCRSPLATHVGPAYADRGDAFHAQRPGARR